MNMQREKNTDFILCWVKNFLILLTVAVSVYLSSKIFPLIFPLLMGMLLAETSMFLSGLIHQIPDFFKGKKERIKRRDGDKLAVVIYFVIFIAIIALIIYGITVGAVELKNFVTNLAENLQKISLADLFDELLQYLPDETMRDSVRDSLGQLSRQISGSVPRILTGALNAATGIAGAIPMFFLVTAISLMSGYYSINENRKLYGSALRLTNNKDLVRNLISVLNKVIYTVFRIVGGYILIMMITFLEALISLHVVGIPDASIWALLIALIDILPVLGIAVVMVPMAVYFGLQGALWTMFGIVICMLIMTILRRFWEPLILGSVIRLHPMVTVLCMILGIVVWGLSGVVLGPIYLVTVREFLNVFHFTDKIRAAIAKRSGAA